VSVEENKALVRRWIEEVYNKGNVAVIDEVLAPNLVHHDLPPEMKSGLEGYKQLNSMLLTAFPDYHATIEDMIAEGDKVVLRFFWSGTHKGEFMGIAPTGKQVTVKVMSMHRIEGGKVVENWAQVDQLGLLQQLGVVPAPEQ
jgi:steroid delta-isomerase-like uncharacterized protein